MFTVKLPFLLCPRLTLAMMLMFSKETSNGGLAVNSKREERVATIKGLFALTSIFPLNINLLPTRWAMLLIQIRIA